jgi:hypothetical protein
VPEPAESAEQIDFIDRRRVVRTVVRIAGRYALANRRNMRGERREFACRTVDLSTDDIAMLGPVTGAVGERVIAHFDELGKLEGRIIRLIENGFVIRLALTPDRREWLAAKIDWLDKRAHHNLPDDRGHHRMIPTKPHSTILLSDGTLCGCFVIDMSASGAAVSAEICPKLGDVLAIGKVIGRVVRIFPEGFAIRFITLQDTTGLESRLIES